MSLVAQYQDRAVALVREAVNRRPAGERSSFVSDVVLADPELRTLRRRISALDLTGPATSLTRTDPGPDQRPKRATHETKSAAE